MQIISYEFYLYLTHISDFQTEGENGKCATIKPHLEPVQVVFSFFCVQKRFECSDLDTEETYLDIKQYGVYVPLYFRVMQAFYFNLNW